MSSLPRSIAELWEGNATLCAMVPFDRVFTGRIPQTELYRFPYVSILYIPGRLTHRSDKTRYTTAIVSFHIWVDANRLEFATGLAEAITDAYADQCWNLNLTDKVIDVLDEGEPFIHQTDLPTVRCWEVVKMFAVTIERARVETDECCPAASGTSGDEWFSSASASSQGST